MEESIQQLALISSVLGGFSITFLSSVLLFGTEKKVKFWLIIGFLSAAMCFLLCALGWSMIDMNRHPAGNEKHHQMLVKLLLLGLISLIISLGMSGWLHQKRTGIATLAMCLFALLYLIFGILIRYIVW